MRIAISGTPGTGKTEVSRKLSELLGYEYIDLNKLAEENGLVVGFDKKRNSKIIETRKFKNLKIPENSVIDGHLSHFVPADLVVVLRTRPYILKERLKKKGWPPKKVEENVEAEVLGICSFEAYEENQRVVEIDTTNKSPEVIAKVIKKMVDNNKFISRQIDWTEDFAGV
ncbi:MAG: adenylate kinase family protein [Candidatus Aenigmarchaeota archaeon]|nr:adenylate kinase family protein [Candidatus Aenigmarchaeota archaeon]